MSYYDACQAYLNLSETVQEQIDLMITAKLARVGREGKGSITLFISAVENALKMEAKHAVS